MRNKKNILKRALIAAVIGSVLLINSIGLYAQPANITVEGEDNYFITGESYPTKIQMSGYNSRDNLLYMNSDFETTKTVEVGETATFNYYIEIFNDTGAELGTLGSYDAPETVAAEVDATTVSITNEEVTLTGPLTAGYRTVITIESVDIAA